MLDALLATEAGWSSFAVGLLAGLFLAVELGFRGAAVVARGTPAQRAQIGGVATALLTLLGLLMAFSFGLVQEHFQARRALVMAEANAIGTAFLRADLLPEPHRTRARELFREYVDLRLDALRTGRIEEGIARSQDLQGALWREADLSFEVADDPVAVGLFTASLNDMIDLHGERVMVRVTHRVPPAVLWTVLFTSVVALGILGVHFGLAGERSVVGTVAPVLAHWAILMLIIDLEHPDRRTTIDQQPLVEVQRTIREASASAPQEGTQRETGETDQ